MVNSPNNSTDRSSTISTVINVNLCFLKCQNFNCAVNSPNNRSSSTTVISMVHTCLRNSAVLRFKYNLVMCSSPVVSVKSIPRHFMFVWEPLPSSVCEGEYISFHYLGCSQNFCFSCPCSTLSHIALFNISFAFSFS